MNSSLTYLLKASSNLILEIAPQPNSAIHPPGHHPQNSNSLNTKSSPNACVPPERDVLAQLAQSAQLTSSTAADEPNVVEDGHLVLDQGAAVFDLRAPVLVVTRLNGDGGAVRDLIQHDHLERIAQGLIGPVVAGQRRAQDGRARGGHQLAVHRLQRVQRAGEQLLAELVIGAEGQQGDLVPPHHFQQNCL